MKTKLFPCFLLALSALAYLAFDRSTHADTRLLPFQGRLTDANGNPVADGARVVQFKIYDAPVGGRVVWNGEVQKLTVNAGLVSTLLGTKADLSRVDFDQELYLELTIDANNDGQIGPADPPLLPRQSVLPAVFAKESANSRLLEGYNWSALFGTSNPADGTLLDSKIRDGSINGNKLSAGVFVPVGGVIMWWGALNQIPANYEICNGEAPTTPGAVLPGNKPDLRDRFVKGAPNTATDVKTTPVAGGSHSIAGSTTGGTALSAAQMPSHQHRVSLFTSANGQHSHTYAIGPGDAGSRNKAADGDQGPNGFRPSTDPAGEHAHLVVGDTALAGSGQPHSHTFPAFDNRPAFLEMFFIIRVK